MAQVQALERLGWLRSEAKLPIAEIARRLKTYPPTVSRWVNGHVAPSPMACTMIEQLYADEQIKRTPLN